MEKWEQKREIGKKKYMLQWSIYYVIGIFFCFGSSWLFWTGFQFKLYDLFLIGILYLMILFMSAHSWNEKEDKYLKLLQVVNND